MADSFEDTLVVEHIVVVVVERIVVVEGRTVVVVACLEPFQAWCLDLGSTLAEAHLQKRFNH